MIKVAFSFDDGRRDNYFLAKSMLEKMKIPATFNVTIGYIENIKNIEKPSEHEPMNLEELKDLYNNDLFEIACHGFEHNNDVDNLVKGIKEIRKQLSYKMPIGLVSPHSEFDVNTLDSSYDIFKKNNVAYLRVGGRFNHLFFLKKVIRKINRLFHIPQLTYFVYKDSFVKNDDTFVLYPIGIYRYNTVSEIKYIVKKFIKNNKSIIFEMHSILKCGQPFYDDLFTWDFNKFYELCLFLKQCEEKKELEIVKVIDFIKK